ncbi:hypothetical protein JQC91_10720 [Jannaschia sp. Os4]|uniref:hypothetical protein n=1 Tax=Jannaschia sp. Os4 TaxID=2807617 RepID=UPI001939A6A1|nr:hypothetical protein [Jannaschia sp. Os4]MBM2576776.1 hypothetical protein [Jannaschia sp. Os4]
MSLLARFSIPLGLASLLAAGPVAANGLGEQRGWQFRSPSDRQILLQGEQTRLNYMVFEQSTSAAPGLGGQTGNTVVIDIGGSGNTIDLSQDNSGDQSIQDAEGGSQNSLGGSADAGTGTGGSVPAAAAALKALP